ncbi:MAG: rhomboid family intramembrane serine protease [Actinobacteria bacterium]|nr:MAG: rhomboid family intramembrane serine protease [Actinomycetota bacterium]
MLPLKDNVPTRTFPVVTVGLIVVNAIVWIWEWKTGVNQDVFHYGYYPCTVHGPCTEPATLFHHVTWYFAVFSSMFMHGGWIHIGGNMLFLWIFGNNVEDAFGRVRFLLWYIAAGLVAIVVQTVVTLWFSTPAGASIPNVGASGAIAGVLGAYLVMLPRAKVLTLFIIVFLIFLREIPAIVFLGVWFLFQLWDGGFAVLHPQAGGGVAFFAHIGGFIFGVSTVYLVAVRRPLRPTW